MEEINILGGVLNSLVFVLAATAIAAVVGLVLGILASIPLLRLDHGARPAPLRSALAAVVDAMLSLCESIPAVAALLVLAIIPSSPEGRDELFSGRLFAFALVAGTLWSAGMARMVHAVMAAEKSRVYPSQFRLWQVSWLVIGYHMLRENFRQLGAALLGIAVYAVVVDSGVSYVMSWASTFRQLPMVSYYGNSLGSVLANLIYAEKGGLFWVVLLAELGVITSLMFMVRRMGTALSESESRISLEASPSDFFSISLLARAPGTRPKEFDFGRSVPITMRAGDVMWLRGESGSGKSLLIKSLFQPICERTGGFRLLPREVEGEGSIFAPKRARDQVPLFVLLPQEPAEALFPYMTPGTFAAKCGFGRGELRDTMQTFLTGDVDNLLGRYPEEMSAGQKRQIATALLSMRMDSDLDTTPLLLLDEPDASLDRSHTRAVMSELCRLGKKGAILMVSHSMHMRQILVETLSTGDRTLKIGTVRASRVPKTQGAELLEMARSGSSEVGQKGLTFSVTGLREPFAAVRYPPLLEEHVPDTVLGESGVRIVGVTGPNGCGKSTYLRALAGLVRRGRKASIIVNGKAVHRLRVGESAREFVTYLFDDCERAFPPTARIGNVLASLTKATGKEGAVDGPVDFETVLRAILNLRSEDISERTVWELSGGERQVLALLAAAMLRRNPVMLLDEPFSRLDAKRKKLMGQLLLAGVFGSPRLFVIASHDLEFLSEFCESVYVLPEGTSAPWQRLSRPGLDTARWNIEAWRDGLWELDGDCAYNVEAGKWR